VKKYKSLFKEEKIYIPQISDEVSFGKFKNKSAIITGFDVDDNDQPVVILSPGGRKSLYTFRVKKLMKNEK